MSNDIGFYRYVAPLEQRALFATSLKILIQTTIKKILLIRVIRGIRDNP